ncbi:histidine kinase [Actinoplanes sp. NBRC 103695]|uniref:sensor histidine kinase n=1 Tax=Actinoplanes sp. NBRC 103695 TaxID=3032202 RepID=UPI0024A26C62|nr:histidine kinase [Actinoplanes sp. NBRC 103695]GLY98332.1 two-component sensor histidine kinase [Actinoplanes sp. NBRC 103695]
MPFGNASALRSIPARWRSFPLSTRDFALTVVVSSLAFVPTVSHLGPEIGDLPSSRLGDAAAMADVALTLGMCLPLALRSRRPAVCLVTSGGVWAVGQVLGRPETFAKVALLLAVYAAGAHLARSRRAFAAAVTAGYLLLAVVLHGRGSPQRFLDFLAFYLVLVVIWLTGAGVRRWRAEEAEHRRLAAEVASSAERARIARDLHDVVTHHVTAMVVQADAAQFLLTSMPDRAADGLTAISETGRRALTELRALLDTLEATGEPTTPNRAPTMGRICDLVEQARLTGQPVDWTEQGPQTPLPVDVELAAYRVVQEALTNAIKYATGRPTTVVVRTEEDAIEIEITTAGPSTTTPVSPSGGRGLAGMRERLRLLDGDLVSGRCPDGSFRVWALIPSRSTE